MKGKEIGPILKQLSTRHGSLSLPTVFPLFESSRKDFLKLAKKYVPNMECIMINFYETYFNRNSRKIMSGAHNFLKFYKPIFMDSGGYMLRGARFPIDFLMEVQQKSNSDIISTLDYPLKSNHPWGRSKWILGNIENALKASEEHSKDSLLFASVHARDSLEMKCYIRFLEREGDFDGYAIGGLVLMRENPLKVAKLVLAARQAVRGKPIHVYGLGGVSFALLLFYIGVDSVDSSTFMRAGSSREYILPGKRIKKEQFLTMKELPCKCPVCQEFAPSEFDRNLMCLHNLWITVTEIRLIRRKIEEGTYEAFARERLKTNLAIFGAFEHIRVNNMRGRYLETC